MNQTQLDSVQGYLEKHALALDLALFNFYFKGGSAQDVVGELAAYQNDDGGFRGSLEHDARLPQSTAVAAWTGFRIMREVGADKHNPVLQRGLEYLVNSYDAERKGWPIVPPEVNDYPHAPWWEYKTAMANFGWGNPSAELLGFFIKYGGPEHESLVQTLTDKALARIHELDDSADFHEVLTFKGLYELAGDTLRAQLREPLERLIKASASLDPEQWRTYSAPPLAFVTAPDDPFGRLFDAALIKQNVEFLVQSLAGDHWEPNWNWDGAYPEAWQEAKREWSGQLTVKNLAILKKFGLIES